MATELTGIVQGSVIRLDDDASPFDGQRVRIRIEPVGEQEAGLSAADNQRLLQEWAKNGPQGPLEIEESWPDNES